MGKTVLLVESNDLLRAGLKSIFANDPRVAHVYEATNDKYSSLLQDTSFDLIVINQALAGDMSTLLDENFVVITSDPNMLALKTAFDYGALSYLTINASADLLRIALDIDKNGFLVEPVLTPLLIKCMFESRSYFFVKEELLTPREREIVNLLRSGLDRSSIARRLHIAQATLKTHIKNIARKRESTLQLPHAHARAN